MTVIVKSYDINGEHFLLDEENKLMLFNSEDHAKNFLKSAGLSDNAISALDIVPPTDEELKDNYTSERSEV